MSDTLKSGGASAPSVPHAEDKPNRAFFSGRLVRVAVRLLMLAVVDAVAVMFVWTLVGDGNYPLAAVVLIVTVGVNIPFINEKFYPFRWFSPGLVLMTIMLVYPTLYTLYTAFTNYGDGHLLNKVQAIEQIESRTYLPEGGGSYTWTGYRSNRGEYALWLQSERGDFLAVPGEPLRSADTISSSELGAVDSNGIPLEIPGYTRFNRIQAVSVLTLLTEMQFGEGSRTVTVQSLDSAQEVVQRYVYDSETDTMTDQTDGKVYRPVQGTFTADDGDILIPGYFVTIGGQNFGRLLRSPSLRGPFVRVFIWTFVFSALSVGLAFSFGLFFAIVFDHPRMPAKKVVRSLLLVPYALPAFISVSVWRGMFQPFYGTITLFLESVFGSSPQWLAHPTWAKIGILIVQTWLGFPYMMLICTGALQALPSDIYEAAKIDGAGALRQFWHLTLPLLLVAVGPLLIASFAFNFNNFTVIDIYAEGGPPIVGTPTPAGHTDILITYIFRLAFSGGRGADFGYASAITIVIFIVLATITALQFRFTRVWEEISENV